MRVVMLGTNRTADHSRRRTTAARIVRATSIPSQCSSWRRLAQGRFAIATRRFRSTRHDRLWQHAAQPVIDDPQIVEARQLGIGLHTDDAILDRRDLADGQTRREDAAVTRADEAVAHLHGGAGRQVQEPWAVGVVAGEYGTF